MASDGFAKHHLRIQGRDQRSSAVPNPDEHAEAVRAWLTALLGADHLTMLVGSGLGMAIAGSAGASGLSMDRIAFGPDESDLVDAFAKKSSREAERGDPNIEDQLRSALQMLAGLDVLEPTSDRTKVWRKELNTVLKEFAKDGLKAEKAIREKIEGDSDKGRDAAQLLVRFLLAFAGRPPSRERLNIFTTNYDRLIEYGADLGGLRVLDRFVGSIEPVFRASRLDVDIHYNPPGIRGEPRYLEGVVRLGKLHGSLDWRYERKGLRRIPLAFGDDDPQLGEDALSRLMVYPNSAKDVETALFPYAELFRDFSAAVCRPNSVLVTFGYGFGDDHINRIIRDMLTLPSSHLLVIAYSDPGDRIAGFLSDVSPEQVSLMCGSHFGGLSELVTHYLPTPGTDDILGRTASRNRRLGKAAESGDSQDDLVSTGGGEAGDVN
jgi:SIR2-like protein